MNFRTISDLNSLIYSNMQKIPREVDLIVGVPRSGMMVASLIALYLNLPLTDIDRLEIGELLPSGRTKKNSHWITSVEQARKILIVEDSSSTGTSVIEVRNKLKDSTYAEKVIYLVAFINKDTEKFADIYFEKVEYPRLFEWNYLHHKRLDKVCFDIDGVLCVDPTEKQNDDGDQYRNFIRNAEVKVVPTFPIGYLVTSRLEKYREDTEYWLKKNGIRYNQLIMMQYNSKEERLKAGSHGKFKGENYKRLKGAFLFVESDARQAAEIAKISGKMVFCTENQKVYTENSIVKLKEAGKKRIKKMVPRSIKRFIKRCMK